MNAFSTTIACLVAVFEAGCASDRGSVPPPMDLPASYTSEGSIAGSVASVDREWWSAFGSPELSSVVSEALTGSHTLKSANERLTAQREVLRATRASFWPELNAGANATREKQSAAAFGLPANALPLPANFNLFQVGLNAGYRFDVFGLTRNQVAQQRALADVQEYQVGAAYLALTGNAVLDAFQLASGRAQLAALRSILEIDARTVQFVREARDLGAVADIDLVRAENQRAADEALEPGIDQQISVSSHALAVLVGKAPSQWTPPVVDFDAITVPVDVPVSLPSHLVHQRPDILASEAQLRVASAQVGVATAQLFPDITLSAGISTTGLSVGDLFSPAGLVWSVAAGLTQPVFDAGMRLAQRRAALALFRASADEYQQTVLEAFSQVANVLEAINHDAQLEQAEQRALETSGRAVTLERISYEHGGSGILDLLDAQRQNQQAVLGRIRARAQRISDSVELFIAMGGGWDGDASRQASATVR